MTQPLDIMEFVVDDQRFGIALVEIREVLRAASLTPVPQAPRELEGLLNFRGMIIPVVDLRYLLGFPPRDIRSVDHLIVLETQPLLSVIRVDQTVGIAHILTNDMEHAANIEEKGEFLIDFVANTSAGIVSIIDTERLFGGDESLVQFLHQVTSSVATEVGDE